MFEKATSSLLQANLIASAGLLFCQSVSLSIPPQALYKRTEEDQGLAMSPYGVAGVHVCPGYRGKGVGEAMMEQALSQGLISSKVYQQTLACEKTHM